MMRKQPANKPGYKKRPHVRRGGVVSKKDGTSYVRRPHLIHKDQFRGMETCTQVKSVAAKEE